MLTLVLVAVLPSAASGSGLGPRPVPWRRSHPFSLPTGERILGVAPAQSGSAALGQWTQVPRLWPVPAGGGGTAYDTTRDEMLTFGGCCFQGDTWLWKEGEWRNAAPTIAPGARAGNVTAYDPVRRQIVMFGGTNTAETWTWDGSGWMVHHQPNGPQLRNDAVIAWMPRLGKVVMVGGYPDIDPNEIGSQLNDTWAWDGSSWQQIVTATSPPDRYGAGLALDPGTGDLVMFGGLSNEYHSLADTWMFDGTTWREVMTDVAPSPRSYIQMASNPTLGAVELFGGYALEQGYSMLPDRWFFANGEWKQELPGIENGPLPPGRFGGGLVHDAEDGTMVLYGGNCDPTCGGVWTERLEVTEHGTESRLVWVETPSPWPPDRMSAGTMVDDPLGRGTLMHGGFGDSTGFGNPNDTWLWDGEWRRLDTEGAPPGRQSLSLAVHRPSKTVVLFGGLVGYGDPDAKTWVLDGDRWEAREPAFSPPGRYQHAMAEDASGDVVLFGGLAAGAVRLGDTWVWNGETWIRQLGLGPSARTNTQMAYDPVRKETVLFGGNDGSGVTSSETWVWDGESWEKRSPTLSPTGRQGAAMAWDPVSRRIVLFGGASCVNVGCLITNDVWTWDGTTWARQESTNGGPSARWYSVAGPSDEGIVMFGGHDGGTGLPFSDTWLWRSTA